MAGRQQSVHHLVKGGPVHAFDGGVDAVHVPLHHAGEHILLLHLIPGHLDALQGRELAPDQLLQGTLHIGIPVVPQLGGEPHHRGLAHAHRYAQTARRHEGRLVVVL